MNSAEKGELLLRILVWVGMKKRTNFSIFVGAEGIGPTTSFLSGKRSTTELRTHIHLSSDIVTVLLENL